MTFSEVAFHLILIEKEYWWDSLTSLKHQASTHFLPGEAEDQDTKLIMHESISLWLLSLKKKWRKKNLVLFRC